MLNAKIGAVVYFLWGVLHIQAAYETFILGSSLEQGVVQGKIYQDAWNLLFFSIASILIAVVYNWKNDIRGYWLNLVLVSTADIGFIIFILLPGNVNVIPGILGPVLWIIAVIFSTLGIRTKKAV